MKLYPESQFNPNFENLSEILSHYSLTLEKFELANSGIENCTVFVKTNDGNYVLRIYRQDKKTEYDVLLETNFVRYLHENDVPVAVPIENRESASITQIQEKDKTWFAILMPLMQGQHADAYTEGLIVALAELQAKMHILAQSFKQGENNAIEFEALREGHFIRLITNRNTLDPAQANFVNRAEAFTVRLSEALPAGLCHLDYDNGNVLTTGNTITAVLDFDDLAFSPFVHCLAYTIWDVAFDRGFQSIQEYLSAYEKIRPLNNAERDILVSIILFRHYVIGCKDIADGQMNDELLGKYHTFEQELRDLISAGNWLR